jgi:predicted phosphodiesterase
MHVKQLVTMSFITDFIGQKTVDMFLGDKEHTVPDKFRYIDFPSGERTLSFDRIPPKGPGMKRIIVISDTHERHEKLRKLPEGDVLVHCGDVLMVSKFFSQKLGLVKLHRFNEWLQSVPCKQKIVIAGNHDGLMERIGKDAVQAILTNAVYLENESINIGKLTLWGTPASAGRSGNRAFQSEMFHKKCLEHAPEKVDILLTHGHCHELEQKVKHHIHLWGHAHNSYGIRRPPEVLKGHPVVSLSVCVPIMDRRFDPSHMPVVLDLPEEIPEDVKLDVSVLETCEEDDDDDEGDDNGGRGGVDGGDDSNGESFPGGAIPAPLFRRGKVLPV